MSLHIAATWDIIVVMLCSAHVIKLHISITFRDPVDAEVRGKELDHVDLGVLAQDPALWVIEMH